MSTTAIERTPVWQAGGVRRASQCSAGAADHLLDEPVQLVLALAAGGDGGEPRILDPLGPVDGGAEAAPVDVGGDDDVHVDTVCRQKRAVRAEVLVAHARPGRLLSPMPPVVRVVGEPVDG
jgi:hypothetical protein